MAFQMLINGELVDGTSSFAVANPSDLSEIGKAPHATQEQCDAAVDAAVAAQPEWAALSLEKRKGYMRKAAKVIKASLPELGPLLVAEQGKPITTAAEAGEIGWALGRMDHYCKELKLAPEKVSEETSVYRRPVGVVVGITPWNYPVYCTIIKWCPAILMGNTFVHKPSPFTPLTGLKIGMLLKDVFPKGVFNVVSGDDKQQFNVGGYLSSHPKVNCTTFTGSVATGKKVMGSAVDGMRRVHLEAGGNDAAIVLPGTDPKVIAKDLFWGAFCNNGQTCCAAKRTFVPESLYDDMVAELVKVAKETPVGDGMTKENLLGPMNNKMQYDKVMGILDDTKKQAAAKIECGGGKVEGSKGYFIEPTIVSGAAEGMRIVDEEQFGPVMPVLKYADADQVAVLKRANDSQYGLGGSVWCAPKDFAKAKKLAGQIQAGTVWVNRHANGGGGPFGGFKESGLGRDGWIPSDLATFTELQSMTVQPKPAPEKRRDPTDPRSKKTYTKKEFLAFYGQKDGEKVWKKAAPKEKKEKVAKAAPKIVKD